MILFWLKQNKLISWISNPVKNGPWICSLRILQSSGTLIPPYHHEPLLVNYNSAKGMNQWGISVILHEIKPNQTNPAANHVSSLFVPAISLKTWTWTSITQLNTNHYSSLAKWDTPKIVVYGWRKTWLTFWQILFIFYSLTDERISWEVQKIMNTSNSVLSTCCKF